MIDPSFDFVAPASREARIHADRLRRQAVRVQGLVRAAVLALALATLAISISGALRTGTDQVHAGLTSTKP